MFYVYILISDKDHRTYTGFTNNVQKRLLRHNAGLVESTKKRIPFKLWFYEEFEDSTTAMKRESWWKSGAGRRKLKELFNKT